MSWTDGMMIGEKLLMPLMIFTGLCVLYVGCSVLLSEPITNTCEEKLHTWEEQLCGQDPCNGIIYTREHSRLAFRGEFKMDRTCNDALVGIKILTINVERYK